MSEIQRYMYARDGMVPDAEHLRGSGEPEFWVRFTDHEAERAENLATIDFLNKELRSAVDALADAEARIEGLVHKEQGFDNADMEYGYGRGLAESIRALAALTQPQTEIEGKPDGTWYDIPDGGGAATAADADLELPLTDSTLVEEVVAAVYEACLDRAMDDPDAIEVAAVLRGELTGTRAATEPGPYAKAFRERVCPVPEFPGIKNRQEDQA